MDEIASRADLPEGAWRNAGCRRGVIRRSSWLPSAVLALLLCTTTSRAVDAAGDPGAGQRLARQWCSGCHVVDAAGTGTDAAPAFAGIARKHEGNEHWLRAWLTAPHPPMPAINLSRGEIDDVIAYLKSLAKG